MTDRDAPRRDLVFALPQIIRLLWRIIRDDRISWRIRGGLVAIAGYLALPFDIIPDWIPILGQLDDFVVLTVGVRTMLRRVPESLLSEHWSGEPAILETLLGRKLNAPSRNGS
jgi:uncharacterized membrane protein YkvA (DUF1232 family)